VCIPFNEKKKKKMNIYDSYLFFTYNYTQA
jgi:hypothetical protein